MRADIFLIERGYAKSRSEAQAAIKAGLVRVDGDDNQEFLAAACNDGIVRGIGFLGTPQ